MAEEQPNTDSKMMLSPDFADLELGTAINNLMADKLNDKENALGVGMATLATCLFSSVLTIDGISEQQKVLVITDLMRFLTYMANNYAAYLQPPPSMPKEKMN